MITRKFLISVICLLCITLVNQLEAAGKEATATFTFGKIEILKTGEREWRFLEKGTALTANDLVRMPPFSLIRLKTADGTFLPTLPGGREVLVSMLVDEGKAQRKAAKGKRINEHFEGSSAIDVLPLGDKPKVENRISAPDSMYTIKVSQHELKLLRGQLDSLPEAVASLIAYLPVSPAQENVVPRPYPGLSLDRAQKLYRELNVVEIETTNIQRPLLYAQMLRYVGLNTDFVVNEKGELLVIFDSGVRFSLAKQIAANQQLIYSRQRKNTIWIRVQIQSPQDSFTTAWYNGSRT